MSKIYGHYVVRNEEHRYFTESLASIQSAVDEIFVFDDQSSDRTKDLAEIFKATVEVRPSHCPSFLDDEGAFRQAAWEMIPGVAGDVVLSLDADEVLLGDWRPHLEALGPGQAIRVPVLEAFADTPDYMVRIDGYWKSITAIRATSWSEGEFRSGMASGSLPVATREIVEPNDIAILHLGYVRQADRFDKYRRYSTQGGHNPRHVQSILKRATMVPLSRMGFQVPRTLV